MLINTAAMLAEFHEALGLPFGGRAREGWGSRWVRLRKRLHLEETRELIDALDGLDGAALDEEPDLAGHAAILRELADQVYIAYGDAHDLGLPLDAAVAEVHMANMRKIHRPNGESPIVDASGKVLKPPEWEPPKIAELIAAVAATPRPYPPGGAP